MVTKKKQEVKQEEALQVKSKTKPEKKTATKKNAETEVKANSETKSQGKKVPSMAEQYNSLKEKHPDALLLFRKGDFYQALNEDARKTSDVLGITLTKPHDKSQGESLAMFPHHSLDIYLPKLIRAGVRVAIIDDISMTKEQKVVTDVKLDDKKQEQPTEISSILRRILVYRESGWGRNHKFVCPNKCNENTYHYNQDCIDG